MLYKPKQKEANKWGKFPVYDVNSGKVAYKPVADCKEICEMGLGQPVLDKQLPVVEVTHEEYGATKVNAEDVQSWLDRGYTQVGGEVESGEDVDTPEEGDDIEAVRAEYERVTGRKPHHLKKIDSLREDIARAQGTE